MKSLFKSSSVFYSRHGLRWLLFDFCAGIIAFWAGHMLTPYADTSPMPRTYYMLAVGALHGFFLSIFCRLLGVPSPERTGSYYEMLVAALSAAVLAFAALTACAYVLIFRQYGRFIAVATTILSSALVLFPRVLISSILPHRPLRVVLYGALPSCHCKDFFNKKSFLEVVGYVVSPEENNDCCADNNVPNIGILEDLSGENMRKKNVETVIVCKPNLTAEESRLLLQLPLHGITLQNLWTFLERHYRKIPVEVPCFHWFASNPASNPTSNATSFAKRLIDISLSALSLILVSPLCLLVAIAIKLESKGPIFFRQVRVGHMSKNFSIVKFRTMCQDAEKDGAQFATKGDARVTRVGRFLRLTRIDEIPQLWNVFKGEMSLVGPRPERPEFVKDFEKKIPLYSMRHLVPPGLTGWAQIRYRYAASAEDAARKLEYDLYYLRHGSLAFDIEIIVKTIPMLMKGSR